MKIWMISAAMFAAVPACAADLNSAIMSPKPLRNWTGFYAGINAGGAWSLDAGFGSSSLGYGSSNGTNAGYTVGAQFGYNYQIERFVIGFEIDAAKASTSSNSTATSAYYSWPNPFVPTVTIASLDIRAEIDWTASARMRLGIAASNNLMFYGIFGISIASAQISSSYFNSAYQITPMESSSNATQVGWTIGAGGAYKFSDNLSATIEATYTDFGNISKNTLYSSGYYQTSPEEKISLTTVRAGLNYHF